MNKLFIRNENLDCYQKDCIAIWEYITKKGIPYFQLKDVEKLWEAYSNRCCAGWLFVTEEGLEQFIDWLEEQTVMC